MMIELPRAIQRRLEKGLALLLLPAGASEGDFLFPPGESALLSPDSVSWRIFKNPLALFVGGVTAVVLELAEPRVRAGVWQNTSFRERPLDRLRRTGYATMMTVYGPRSRAEAMIARVTRLHANVRGVSGGRTYSATDPDLLTWVHATASFGFLEAYSAYVLPVGSAERDVFYAEGQRSAKLYGAMAAPDSQKSLVAMFDRVGPRLEASEVIADFLRIMRRIDVLPMPFRFLQGLLIKAAVEAIPTDIRQRLNLGEPWTLKRWQRQLVCRAGAAVDRLVLGTNPAVLACRRLGLHDHHLYPLSAQAAG